MELKDLIEDYKNTHSLSNTQLAELFGVNNSTISRWINGKIKNVHEDTLITMNNIFGFNVEPIIKGISVDIKRPILGYAKAGYNMYVQENHLGYESVSEEEYFKGDYFLEIQGDSMKDAGIHDGDLVFVKQCSNVNSGDIGVVLIEDEVTIKRVIKKNNMLILKAANDDIEDRCFTADEVKDLPVTIIGKVVYSKTYF